MHPTAALSFFNGFAFCERHTQPFDPPLARHASNLALCNQIRNRETRRRLVMGDSMRTRSDFKCLGAQGAPPLVQLDLFHFIGGVHSRSNLQYTCIHARSYLCTNTDLPSSFAAVQITFHAQCHRKASRRE